MFLGAHSLRRTTYLSRAARVLSRHNCLLQISDGAPSPGDTSSYLGLGRWPLLARTKVLINIHRSDDSRFEWRPALDAIHAGAVVVTEHASGIAPLEPGEHLLVASPDALPYVVETLLRDEQRLARIRAQAYERLSAWIPYALWVSVLRASVVELVGEPIPPGTAMGTLRPEDVQTRAACAGVAAAEGCAPYSTFSRWAVLVFLLILLAAIVAGCWAAAGRLLAPLSETAETVRQLGPQNLGQRIRLGGSPDALRELADADRRRAGPARVRLRQPAPVRRQRLARAAHPAGRAAAADRGGDGSSGGQRRPAPAGPAAAAHQRAQREAHRGAAGAGRERPRPAGQGAGGAGRAGRVGAEGARWSWPASTG